MLDRYDLNSNGVLLIPMHRFKTQEPNRSWIKALVTLRNGFCTWEDKASLRRGTSPIVPPHTDERTDDRQAAIITRGASPFPDEERGDCHPPWPGIIPHLQQADDREEVARREGSKTDRHTSPLGGFSGSLVSTKTCAELPASLAFPG